MRPAFPLLVPVLVVAVVGCSSGDPGDASDQAGPTVGAPPTLTPTRAAPAAPTFDPPLEFAPDSVQIGRLWHGQYAVHDAVAYFLDGGVEAGAIPDTVTSVELTTGDVRWSTGVETGVEYPDRELLLGDRSWSAPVVAEVEGRPWVFAVFPAIEVGTGTAADRRLARVVALDAVDGSEQWTADYDLTELEDGLRARYLWGVGVTDETLVLTTPEGDDQLTVAVDAITGDLRWHEPELRAQVVDSGTVLGLIPGRRLASIAAHAVTDGEQVWTYDSLRDYEIDSLGQGIVAFRADVDVSGVQIENETRVVSSDTGDVVASVDMYLNCLDDQTSVVVCGYTGFLYTEYVAAFDRETGELLWELTGDSDRAVPEVRAVRAGVVYARGPRSWVVLDARTGEDLIDDLASFPGGRVIAGFALVRDGDYLLAYPATG